MKVLLVEPDYYTRYPPLGLLKLATYHHGLGDEVMGLFRGLVESNDTPNRIYVTSLFTWGWRPVWKAVRFYKTRYPSAEVWLGGIYASLLPEHAKLSGADRIWEGLFHEAEDKVPDYSLVPEWKSSLLFFTRGCSRRCGFCAVPKLEGALQPREGSIRRLIYPGHSKVVFFDNNILGSSIWRDVFLELIDLNVEVDFNQGMDARYVTEEVVDLLSKMKFPMIRLAYDYTQIRPHVEKATNLLKNHGISGRRVSFYVLYNYVESPDEFFYKVRDLLSWGVVAYPMRYEPLCTLEKGKHVSPKWTEEELEMVQRARRVIGFGGAFPPYTGLVEKFQNAQNFHDAFSLRERGEKPIPRRVYESEHDSSSRRYFAACRRQKN
jgi:hypothetical protein